jgi:hypothetical protein
VQLSSIFSSSSLFVSLSSFIFVVVVVFRYKALLVSAFLSLSFSFDVS